MRRTIGTSLRHVFSESTPAEILFGPPDLQKGRGRPMGSRKSRGTPLCGHDYLGEDGGKVPSTSQFLTDMAVRAVPAHVRGNPVPDTRRTGERQLLSAETMRVRELQNPGSDEAVNRQRCRTIQGETGREKSGYKCIVAAGIRRPRYGQNDRSLSCRCTRQIR